jgi:hypothetical protein
MVKRIGVFASMAFLVAAVLHAPASADPGVIGEDKPVVFTFKNVNMMDGSTAASANCVTVPSPRPTKSNVNGGSAHWGAKITCDRIAELSLEAWVVQWINGYEYVADTRAKAYATNSYLSVDAQTQCVGYAPIQWQVKFVPKVDGLSGIPPVGRSAKVTLTCE